MGETGFSPSSLQPFQLRVIDEKNQLDEKRSALDKFFESLVFSGLAIEEQGRLKEQARVMKVYSDILGERITNFYSIK